MSNGNIIITKTVNSVEWKVDETSYQKALKRIKSLKTAHEKPAKALEAAQKRATQSEGKAALVAARAESRRLALQQKLTAESRKQMVIDARAASNEQRHAQRMAAITARGTVRNPAGRAGLVPKSPKSIAEAIQQAEQDKRTQQIRAKGIRFSTATNGYNLTSRQRAQAISDFANLTKQYHAGSMALGEYNARVGKLQQSLRQQGGLIKKPVTIPVKAKVTGLDTSLLDHAGTAITISATFGIGKSIMQAGQNFESMMNGLQAVTGDPRKAGQEMEYLQQQALKLGLGLQQTSKDYVKFYASAAGKATDGQIKNLFEGVSQYGTVLGATGEEQSRALLALNQMYSKGTVQAEELKGQLGDALPNAVGIFVKALNKMKGRTDLTEKDLMGLMDNGDLLAKDILPFVGDEFKAAAQKGGAFEKSLKSNRVAMMKLQTTIQIAQKDFFNAGFGASLTKTFDGLTTAINNNQGAIQTLGEIAGDVLDGFRDAAFGVVDAVVILRAVIDKYFPDLAKTFEGFGGTAAYATGIAIFTGALWKLGGALKWIVSFLNPLKGLVGTLGKLGALGGISTPGTDNDKPNKKGGKGVSIGLPAIIAAVSLNDRAGAVQADPDGFLKKVQANNDKPTMWTDIKNFVATTFGSSGGSPYAQGPQLPGINNLAAGIGAGRPVEVEGRADLKVQTEVKLTLDDSKFSDAIRAEVQNHDQQNINMLLGVPN